MIYLLDTNICVYWLKGNDPIEQKILNVGWNKLFVSFMTLSELYYGVYKSQKISKNLLKIKNLEKALNVIESNPEICETFGMLKADLTKQGKMIDNADLFIAASALVSKSVLVTNNEKHFERIQGLKLENWLKT